MVHEKNQAALDLPLTSSRPLVSMPGPLVLPLAFALSIFMLLLLVRAVAAQLPAGVHVFAEVQPMMPGQPADGFNQDICHKYGNPYLPTEFYCALKLDESAFHRLGVFVTKGVVSGVTMNPRNMRLIDLVWRWGKPDLVYRDGNHLDVRWYQPVNVLAEIGRRYSLHAPVSRIFLSDGRL